MRLRIIAIKTRKIESHWQDAKRRLWAFISPDQGIDHSVQGAVAATGHYPLGTVLDGLPDEPSQILPAPRNINIDLDARLSDMLYCRLDLGPSARLLMQDKTGFGRLFQNWFFFHGGCVELPLCRRVLFSHFIGI